MDKSKMKRDPVKKNMDKFHKPRTYKDRTKYDRNKEAEEIDRMVEEGGPSYSELMQDELEPIRYSTEYDDDVEEAAGDSQPPPRRFPRKHPT